MKTYFNEQLRECTVIIPAIIKDKDGYYIPDMTCVGKALKALKTLGKHVTHIYAERIGVDIDTPYYNRKYDADFMESFYSWVSNNRIEVFYENGRLYTNFWGEKIILPKDTRDSHTYCLTLAIEWE